MEQTKKIHRLRIVKALVRPDRRAAYLERWSAYIREMHPLDARAWLFEDEALPGRFVEFTEYLGAAGIETRLRAALDRAGVPEECVRRSGGEERYREVRVGSAESGAGGAGGEGGA